MGDAVRPGRPLFADDGVLRLAVWSGPRNISTAFMRSWENREDTVVVDEPFYAHYLAVTGLEHPGREAVLRHHESDWQCVLQSLRAEVPAGVRIFYQKQMAHHLLPGMDRDWLGEMTHVFLIRDPRPMLASLAQKLGDFDLLETGLPQQVEIYDRVVATTGRVPPIVDAADVLAAPEPMLRRLCAALAVPFSRRMLHWPPGPRDTDGIWAKHWYQRVEASTGFEAREPAAEVALTARLAEFEARCRPLYEKLHEQRLLA